ncbi:hypothetical protein ACLESD_00405 [Pyxidicoccus sp. 3LFB2]
MRRDLQRGRIEMHLGAVNVNVLVGFIAGYRACLVDNGVEDTRYEEFSEWLRLNGEFPPEGWAEKYLRDSSGDHLAAITRFLDLVGEFTAQRDSEEAGPSPQDRLWGAVESGSLEEAIAAVGAGADVNAADEYGETPMTGSVLAGAGAQTSTELVEYLLSQHDS